jgi:hypothetical protein
MITDYLTQGYLVFRGIVPPSLVCDLRVEADKARELAHGLNGPQTQRIQPLSEYADRLNLKPFQDYAELPELGDAIRRLLGPGYTHAHLDIMGILVEPLDRPWNSGWHRDVVSRIPPDVYDELIGTTLAEVWNDLRFFNQVNCAIYADSCLWFVPGSHLRYKNPPGERVTDPKLIEEVEGLPDAEAERILLDHCQQFPGAIQMHLAAGDFAVYRHLGWHSGNYVTYQPRATIHDLVCYEPCRSWSGWERFMQARQKVI